MQEDIRQDAIIGSRRFSNYFWGAFLALGGICFLLAGLSSYFKIDHDIFSVFVQRISSKMGEESEFIRS